MQDQESMSSQANDFPGLADSSVDTTGSRLASWLTALQEQKVGNDHPDSGSGESAGQEQEELSQDPMAIVMGLMQHLMNMGEMSGSSLRIIPGSELPMFLGEAGISELNSQRRGAVERIDSEIREGTQALSLIPDGSEDKPDMLNALGVAHFRRFNCLSDLSDINKAIELLNQAVTLTPDDYEDKPDRLTNLGDSYVARFQYLGEPADLDRAIGVQKQAVLLTPNGHSHKALFLNVLASTHVQRFERCSDVADIDKAIEYQSEGLRQTPNEHTDRALSFTNLALSNLSRFDRLRDPANVDEAVSCLDQAVLLTPDGHPDRLDRLNTLGVAYCRRFEQLGDLSDADSGIEYLNQAVLLTPDGDEDKPSRLLNLGTAYAHRFGTLDQLADIDKAIEFQSQAVSLTPNFHPTKSTLLDNLGSSYRVRFERLGELTDIDRAIECHRQSVMLAYDGHSAKPLWLNSLGISLVRRFERFGAHSDIEDAIKFMNEALLCATDKDVNKSDLLNSIGSTYAIRYESTGELEDLEKAIECQNQALLLTSSGHPNRAPVLANLAASHMRRFRHLGALADVDKAIEYMNQSWLLTADGHPSLSVLLSNLGQAYQARFEQLHELADIDKGIEYTRRAVLLAPDGHASKPGYLGALGNAYMYRFDELKDEADLEKAIRHMNAAALLTPDGHTAKSTWLNNLGHSYYRRFEQFGDVEDIEKAINFTSQAVELTPDRHKDKPDRLTNLGNSYSNRFNRLGNLSDLNKAIDYHSQAVQLTPDGHAIKPALLHNMAESYNNRFKLQGDLLDLECSRSYFQQAAQLAVTLPALQLRSARAWAKASSLLGVSPELAYVRAMELVPRLIWLGTTIAQRYTIMNKIGDVAMEAASWAISAQSYDLALQWLEEGRSIVWNQVLQLRTPFDELFAVDPVLAGRLQGVARQLDYAGSRPMTIGLSDNSPSEMEQDAQKHHRLAGEWERLLGQARELPGFQSFMYPRTANELRTAVTSGPVVIINTHSTRCDALIIDTRSNTIGHVPLENFSPMRAAIALSLLKSLVGQRGERSGGFKRLKPTGLEDPSRPMLALLWWDVVKPILEFLGYTRELPADELPRITWCTTGALSFLPLHAAGLYDGSQPNACDLVISSYAPTLSAFLSPTHPLSATSSGVLAVGQESSQDLGDLPYTVLELAAIREHTREIQFRQLDGRSATVDAVLSAMDQYSWLHLACHATQSSTNPAHSAFHLYDGNLTLETITQRSFKNKGLAFLSACETATGDETLPDESVHLAAGMLMAGYPSVIATMWSILDEDAPEIAGQVYGELLKDGKMDYTGAARALHKAVSALREKVGEDSFDRWMPFIHMGV